MPLLSEEDLAAIREIGVDNMIDPVQIFRPGSGPVDTAAPAYNPSTDLGDDEIVDPDPEIGATPIASLDGWFLSRTATITEGDQQVGAVALHLLRLPWGTDVKANHMG
jgi:hypothetical protein